MFSLDVTTHPTFTTYEGQTPTQERPTNPILLLLRQQQHQEQQQHQQQQQQQQQQ